MNPKETEQAKEKLLLTLEDGTDVDLYEVLGKAVVDNLVEAGFPVSDDGRVDFKALPAEVKTEAQEKLEKAETAANFIKFVTLPQEKHAEFGVKQINTGAGSFGATVPTELADEILLKKERFNVFRNRAFTFQLTGPFDLPLEGDGVTGFWVGEVDDDDANLVTASTPTVTKKTLDDHYLAALVKASWKLLDTSAFNIVNYIATLSGRKLAEEEEKAFIGGNGTGRPKGIRTESVESIAVAGQSGLAYSDLVKLWFKLPAQYRANAIFLTSGPTASEIVGLVDNEGRPIFQAGQPLDEVFRRPLVESADIPTNLGSGSNESELWFGDPFYYWIKYGQNLQVATDHVIERLQTKILVYQAVDGKLTHPESWVKLTGTAGEADVS